MQKKSAVLNGIEFSKATEEDIEEIHRLGIKHREKFGDLEIPGFGTQPPAHIHSMDNRAYVLIMKLNGEIIGFSHVEKIREKVAELKHIGLLKPYRAMGLGRRLLDRTFEVCRENFGSKKLFLCPSTYPFTPKQSGIEAQKRRKNWFEKSGFKPHKGTDWQQKRL